MRCLRERAYYQKEAAFQGVIRDRSMSDSLYCHVAVPSPLRRLFDYLPPDQHSSPLAPGLRVIVPFGRRRLVGVLVSQSGTSTVPPGRLKPIIEVLDRTPIVCPSLLNLYLWAADYYQAPPGEALATMLPALLRRGEALPSTTAMRWRLTTHGLGLPAGALRRSPRQQQALSLLQPVRASENMMPPLTDLQRSSPSLSTEDMMAANISGAVLRELRTKGLIETVEVTVDRSDFDPTRLLGEDRLTLRAEQRVALNAIEPHRGYQTFLVDGVTGSGKTEVYLQAIEKVLRYGQQALVLVPEISLTPQTLRRFRRRFQCPIAVLHSGLTDRERLDAWRDAATGYAGIVIGTRSAVFTPLRSPGIVIVDEEHDPSFKQQDGFRYSARDVAVMRAHRENIPIVLGSATPSLETLLNCQQGRYRHLVLRDRAGAAQPPRWQLVDLRRQPLRGGYSAPLIEAMRRQLDEGSQVLVFLNRRGFAPTLLCHDCGWIASCARCDSRLTLHQANPGLLCHHCEYREPVPITCPSCHSGDLRGIGQGTERGESLLAAMFPGIPIIRVDRDSTRRKGSLAQMIDRIDSGAPCILIGTQMLAKGHHFPGVTLVALVDADSGLFSPDFRAIERMGQLLTQVAGRAGRGDRPGTVILQSYHCDHPLITTLTQQGYAAFAGQLLAQRQHARLPPFTNMALVRAEAETAEPALAMLQEARALCAGIEPATRDLRYLGPIPAPMERRNGRFRFQLVITATTRGSLQRLLAALGGALEDSQQARRVRWSIDVDPQDTH